MITSLFHLITPKSLHPYSFARPLAYFFSWAFRALYEFEMKLNFRHVLVVLFATVRQNVRSVFPNEYFSTDLKIISLQRCNLFANYWAIFKTRQGQPSIFMKSDERFTRKISFYLAFLQKPRSLTSYPIGSHFLNYAWFSKDYFHFFLHKNNSKTLSLCDFLLFPRKVVAWIFIRLHMSHVLRDTSNNRNINKQTNHLTILFLRLPK